MTRYWHNGTPTRGDDWAAHLRRGSRGGEDFVVGAGTPAYAPDDGLLQFLPAAARPNKEWGDWGFDGAGQVLLLLRRDGVEFMLFHAADAIVALGGKGVQVTEGQYVGRSGGKRGTPSQGLSTGAHMHEHAVVRGRRVRISDVAPISAGGGSAHIPESEEDEVKTCQMHYTDSQGVVQRIAFTPGTPWYLRWTEGGSTIANGIATSLDTKNSVPATESMFAAVIAAAERLRTVPTPR